MNNIIVRFFSKEKLIDTISMSEMELHLWLKSAQNMTYILKLDEKHYNVTIPNAND